MAANKIVVNNAVILDLTNDSVAADKLLKGTTAHNAAGEAITGTYIPKTMTVDGTTLKLAPAAISGQTVIV